MNKISFRIKIISFILSLLLVSLIAITVHMNNQSKHDGYVIHIIGKERMLTQKMAKELFLNLYRHQSEFDAFNQAKNEFSFQLYALETGTPDGKIAPPPNRDITERFGKIEELSENFFSLAESIKTKIALGNSLEKKEIDDLYLLNNHLLDEIDQTVQAYTKASEQKIQLLEWIQYAGAFAAFLAIGGSILLSRQIDEEFGRFLNHAKEVSNIRCEDSTSEVSPVNTTLSELDQAKSNMKTFLIHVENILQKAQNALHESKNTLIQIEDAARMMETQLKDTALSDTNKVEINEYIDMSEDLTINSLDKIANTEQMLNKFQMMLDKMVLKMEQNDSHS